MAEEKPRAPTANLELVACLVTLTGALCITLTSAPMAKTESLAVFPERAAPQVPATSHERASFALSLNTRCEPHCCKCRNSHQSRVVNAFCVCKGNAIEGVSFPLGIGEAGASWGRGSVALGVCKMMREGREVRKQG